MSDAYKPFKRPEGVENGYIQALREKQQFFEEHLFAKPHELLAELKDLAATYGMEDQDYLLALEDLILKYKGR